ncbi:GntR family transcriptional regulator [Humitalea rosea]|uniref:GntR family transcriptional regulator n=1 Tax=Humitalea rosea TaxID=990373 RepID=A0A2W7IND4_9PROT|nr:FadR/GntR family transcriptional regulator [Humitalea rosea]PZW48599.1 GntR family transcriptional regulator [Humitalea rosea]
MGRPGAKLKTSDIENAKTPSPRASREPAAPTRSVPAAFAPIRPLRISEEIGARIRQQIAAGELKPNDRLPTERELSDMFAVSRMAVREGMRNLEAAGLITLRKGRNGGAFVAESGAKLVTQSFRDMIDLGRASLDMLLEARLHVMGTVVRLACRRATPADLVALQQNLDEAAALTERGLLEERTSKAIGFNRLLAEATGNIMLTAVVEGLSEVLRHFVAQAGRRVHDPVLAVRRKLLAQISARDEEGAVLTMETYLRGLQDYLDNARR